MLFGSNSYLTELDPTQPNPTQPMGQPNPWPCLCFRLKRVSIQRNASNVRNATDETDATPTHVFICICLENV